MYFYTPAGPAMASARVKQCVIINQDLSMFFSICAQILRYRDRFWRQDILFRKIVRPGILNRVFCLRPDTPFLQNSIKNSTATTVPHDWRQYRLSRWCSFRQKKRGMSTDIDTDEFFARP
jgi:hypothetical protein